MALSFWILTCTCLYIYLLFAYVMCVRGRWQTKGLSVPHAQKRFDAKKGYLVWLQLIFLKNLVRTLRRISWSRRTRSGASATCYLHYHAVMTIVHDVCGRHWRWLLLDTVNWSWWSSGLYTTTNICRLTMSTHQIIIICKISHFTIQCETTEG